MKTYVRNYAPADATRRLSDPGAALRDGFIHLFKWANHRSALFGAIIVSLASMAVAQEPANEPPSPEAVPTKVSNTNTVRLNFRGVPLEMVLNHLAEATDLIINVAPGTEVKGKVDVWSNHPLTRDEAVDLLNTILNQNGLAAIRNNRMLTIVSREEAKTRDIPVKSGNKPAEIPKSDQMVTQIIPVQHANAVQLVQNLQPLLATYATLSANESGNALVFTGTQSDARRMAEIVQALDTSISSVSTIRVFPLNYADATELAAAVKQLFEPPAQSNDRRTQLFNRFFGGGGPDGGRGDGGRRGGGASTASGNPAATRVIAVPDERSNSLVVSAPEELIPTIEQLVKEVDVSVSDLTELRVFPLKNADPMELADIFAELFPDETTTGNNNQGEFRFGRGGPPGFPFRGGRTEQTSSQRMKKKGRVIAVPDQRTSSIIISAASELMPQIEQMIEQLDSSGAKKQKVFVYSLENADVQQVEEIVRDMFDRGSMSGNRNNANQNSPLLNRSQQNQQNMGVGTGNTGLMNGQGRNNGGNLGGQFR